MKTRLIGILMTCLFIVIYGQEIRGDKNDESHDLKKSKGNWSSFARGLYEAGFDKLTFEQSMTSGRLIDHTFQSTYLGEERTMFIYLPTCDDSSGCEDKTYPVVYILHPSGFGTHGGIALRFLASFVSARLDNLIGQGEIRPMIAVFPDGSEPNFGGSFYTNSDLYGPFEDHIVEEIVSIIDNNFPAKTSRKRRGVLGQSMGGFGAMKSAFNHTDTYRAVASHSGPLDLSLLPTLIDSILAEYSGSPYNYNPTTGKFSGLLFQMAGAFSPNLSNPPYYVDLPLDSQGNIIDSVFNKWLKHNPARLAKKITPDTQLAIYFDVGMEDELGLFPFNQAFCDSLVALGIDFDYRPYEGGGHFNAGVILNRVQESLAFMDSVLYLSGCNSSTSASKQLAAIDFDPSDLAIEYEDKIYDEYRNEIENIFAILGLHPKIQFDLYHLLKDSKPFINGETKKQSLAKETNFEFANILNRIRVNSRDSATKGLLKSVLQIVEDSNADATYDQLMKNLFNHLSNNAQELAELDGDEAGQPKKFDLKQNYPNPFNPATTIRFSLEERTFVSLAIYNTVGQKVATVVNQVLTSGEKSVTWDATGFASGIYFMKLQAAGSVQVRKMILMQ